MYNLNYTPTTSGVQSWTENISGGSERKRLYITGLEVVRKCSSVSRLGENQSRVFLSYADKIEVLMIGSCGQFLVMIVAIL